MRIAYLHQYFRMPAESGGTRSYDLAKGFVQMGHSVDMITTTSDSKKCSSAKWTVEMHDGINVHYIYLPYESKLSYPKRIMVFLSFMWAASIRLLDLKVDLVLASSTPLTIGIPAMLKRLFHRTPYIFEVRDVWPEAVVAIGAVRSKPLVWVLERVEWVIYRYASAIVPLSTDMRLSILSRFPDFREKTSVVIENIAEIERFSQSAGGMGDVLIRQIGRRPRFIVLYAGTFGKVNGLRYLVQLAALSLVKDPDLVYVAVGDGVEKESLKAMALQSGVLGVNLFMIDPVAKSDLPLLYAEADMGSSFVVDLKPLWSNSANKFFDTLAAGKPIMINHCGWQSEVITLSECGFVLPPNLNAQSVDEFVRYTFDEKKVALHGLNARGVAKERYSLQKAVESYMEVFKFAIR